MKNILYSVLVAGLLTTSPLHAGKNVSLCRDENGNPYFSDVGCPRETEKEGVFYAPNVQSSGVDLTRGKAAMATRHQRRVRRYSIKGRCNRR
jgi:hypothetical protein